LDSYVNYVTSFDVDCIDPLMKIVDHAELRTELGRADDDEAATQPGDVDEGPIDIIEDGRLSPDEKAAVMMDLRPHDS